MVRFPFRQGLAASLFMLLATVLVDPPLPMGKTPAVAAEVWARPEPKPKAVKVPPLGEVSRSPGPAVATSPRSPQPLLTWESSARKDPGILGRLRDDSGLDASPEDFDGPGPLEAVWTLLKVEGPATPWWLRAKVGTAASPAGDGLAVKMFFTVQGTRLVVSLVSPPGPALWFSGLSFELFEYPIQVGDNVVLVSPQVGVWSRPVPQGQSGSVLGGLWQVNLEVPLDEGLGLWIDGRGKSAGWAPGSTMDQGWSLQAGIHWFL